MELTDWFKPPLMPERVGWYEAQFFDCGWSYEWRVWFDGHIWRNEREGWALQDQKVTWRGQTEQTK